MDTTRRGSEYMRALPAIPKGDELEWHVSETATTVGDTGKIALPGTLSQIDQPAR